MNLVPSSIVPSKYHTSLLAFGDNDEFYHTDLYTIYIYDFVAAMTLNNLADFYNKMNKYKESEKECGEALELYRQLAKNNPDAYQGHVAIALDTLANAHRDTNMYEEAVLEFEEALQIFRSLIKTNRNAFLPNLSETLYNMALLQQKQDKRECAEVYAQESLNYYRELVEMSKDAFSSKVEECEKLLMSVKKTK